LIRKLGLNPTRPPTPKDLLSLGRKPSPLWVYPVTSGILLRLLEIPIEDLVEEASFRAPRDIAARAIVRALVHPHRPMREFARQAASSNISLKPAEPELRKMLNDRRPDVRKAAAGHLYWQESPQVSAILEHIDRQMSDPAIRRLGFNDLEKLAVGILVRLRGIVDQGSAATACAALGNLWKIGDTLLSCRDAIKKAGTHRSPRVRERAVMALKPMLQPESHWLLCRAFDRSSTVGQEALQCLVKQDRPLDFWREWLIDGLKYGRSRDRAQAARLLVLVKEDREGVDAVLLAATRDRRAEVREAAVKCLDRKPSSREKVDRMRILLQDTSDSVAIAAATALIPDLVDAKVRKVLLKGLRSRDADIRLAALLATENLRKAGRFAFHAVRLCLRHPDVNVVNHAINALEAMEKIAIPEVRRLADGGRRIASKYARWILAKAAKSPHAKVPAGPYIS
jgi:HEAT repeat protein